MKNSRPRIKYSQTPHSISRLIETLSNKTAAALLSLITRKTVGFGQGFVDLPYSLITKELQVASRTISSAAKLLEQCGAIVRERVNHRIYRWRIVLSQDEILEDPRGTFLIKNQGPELAPEAPPSLQVLIDRSGPCGSIDQDHADRSIRTQEPAIEHASLTVIGSEEPSFEQENGALKNYLKETHVKKHHVEPARRPSSGYQLTLDLPSAKSDDEPLYKHCLRSLVKYGLSQRMARKLCREHSHDLISQVLEHVPQLSGVENLPGYLVTAIRDGGYSTTTVQEDKKNAHQVTGGRSNYAHLTDHNVKLDRHKTVKGQEPAPIGYRSPEETQKELEALELKRAQRDNLHNAKRETLRSRFLNLSDDVKAALKQRGHELLLELVGNNPKRSAMLDDPTLKRVTNQNLLESFFSWLDRGVHPSLALQRI